MILDGRIKYGKALVKEGMVVLEGGERRSTSSREGDIGRGGSGAFLFPPEKVSICCSDSRPLIVNGYQIDVMAGIYRKLVRCGGC